MSDERTVAPGPGRVAQARRAGLRPRSRWFVTGALALTMAAALSGADGSWGDAVGHGLAAFGRPGGDPWAALSQSLVAGLSTLWAVALMAVAAGTLLGGGWGPRRRADLARLQAAEVRPSTIGHVLLALALIVGGLALGGSVVAAAARAPGASAAGLAGLYSAWIVRVLAGIGALAMVAGGVERWLGARAIHRALHQTPEQARQSAGARR